MLYDPGFTLLYIYPKDIESLYRGDTYTPKCNVTLFITVIQTRCPSAKEWLKKMWCVSTVEYYPLIKKDENLSSLETWMKLENVALSKLSQKQEDKHYIFIQGNQWLTIVEIVVNRDGEEWEKEEIK